MVRLLFAVQSEILALRLIQDSAFQQAVQSAQVEAAAKAAVSLLGVRFCSSTYTAQPATLHTQCTLCSLITQSCQACLQMQLTGS